MTDFRDLSPAEQAIALAKPSEAEMIEAVEAAELERMRKREALAIRKANQCRARAKIKSTIKRKAK